MTAYVPAYDVENINECLDATRIIAELHRRYELPATFFVVGKLLERYGSEYKSILDDPLFDVQSHSYSHKPLKDFVGQGQSGVGLDEMEQEVALGKKLVEDVFERPCVGLRPGGGFHEGFRGAPDRLEVLARNGIRFVSAFLRGPLDSIPGPLADPFWYADDGYPDLLELPGHGWHDNCLKAIGGPYMVLTWPPLYPWAVIDAPPNTPAEEAAILNTWLDHAVEEGYEYFSPVMHPWSNRRFDQNCGTIDLMLRGVKERGLEVLTYLDLYERQAGRAGKLGHD